MIKKLLYICYLLPFKYLLNVKIINKKEKKKLIN
jgi:hypothetical protein